MCEVRIIDHHGINKGFASKFHEGQCVQRQIPKESWKVIMAC